MKIVAKYNKNYKPKRTLKPQNQTKTRRKTGTGSDFDFSKRETLAGK